MRGLTGNLKNSNTLTYERPIGKYFIHTEVDKHLGPYRNILTCPVFRFQNLSVQSNEPLITCEWLNCKHVTASWWPRKVARQTPVNKLQTFRKKKNYL